MAGMTKHLPSGNDLVKDASDAEYDFHMFQRDPFLAFSTGRSSRAMMLPRMRLSPIFSRTARRRRLPARTIERPARSIVSALYYVMGTAQHGRDGFGDGIAVIGPISPASSPR